MVSAQAEALESSILLQRDIPDGDACVCDSCGDTRKQLLLSVLMEHNWLTLCPPCEGDLLAQMLRNYLRRKSRGKRSGFTGDIPKAPDAPPAEVEVIDLAVREDGSFETLD